MFNYLPLSFLNVIHYNSITNTVRMSTKCIFCKIISGDDVPAEILFQDDDMLVLKDIKPVAKNHFLAIPKQHIESTKCLTMDDISLIEKLVTNGRKVLEECGGDQNDVRLGFHIPPFNSISHLHLHLISPTSEMSYFHRFTFKPNTWWFNTVDEILMKLNSKY